MKVSIITATHNSAKTIRDNVVSVQHQSYRNIEHIIIDGNSSDDTLAVVNKLDFSGPVISERDKGLYDAMNKGLQLSTGQIVGILNSDDYYCESNVLERVVQTFEETGCDAVYGDLYFVDRENKNIVTRKWIAGEFERSMFYQGWMPPHPTFFVKREVYEKYGHFNLDFRNSSDYEIILRFLLCNNMKVKYLRGVMVHMRNGGISNRKMINRIYAHVEDYLAWSVNGIKPRWYTLLMKPLRKVGQFVIFRRSLRKPHKPAANYSTQTHTVLVHNNAVGAQAHAKATL